MFTRYRSKISPVENLRGTYCLHGTVSFFARKYLLFTRDRLFEIVKELLYPELAVFFSAIYHVNMRRSILFSVMAPKRKTADVEENDSTDTEKYFTLTDEEVSLLLQIDTAYKNEKINEGNDWESIKSRYELDIQKLFCERYPKSATEPEHFPNVIDSAKVFN